MNRSLSAVVLSASLVLAPIRSARADDTVRVWPATVAGEQAFRPRLTIAEPAAALAPRSTDLLRELHATRDPAMLPIRMTKEEKVILIVAVCVVGALLLFATIKIGVHNGPF